MTKILTTIAPPTRRQFLTGTAALLAAARVQFPGGAFAATAAPEVTKATLGYIALTDSAPLIIAKEKGLFAKYGMPDVEVNKQASWGATRDNLELGGVSGGIDGGHILSPMPYLLSLGTVTKNNQPVPMQILARLNVNGQCISIANAFSWLKVGTDATALKSEWEKISAAGRDIKCAVTFPGGTHDLWMRYWLAANGINPEKDVSVIVVPPPQMVANMKVGTMDAFCVGEPWNDQLVHQNIGFTAITTGELWHDHPEKAFAMRSEWTEKNPRAAKALLMAVLEAQQWCDQAANKEEMCKILGTRAWFNVTPEDILPRAQGTFDYGTGKIVKDSPELMKFWRNNASYPYQSHDLWFLTENVRWGKIAPATDLKATIGKVNREDLWREAANELGVPASDIPASTSRGLEKFFDGVVFDPEKPEAYLAALKIKKV
jgi:nitrate/nitrite transport system substrate-binding protein